MAWYSLFISSYLFPLYPCSSMLLLPPSIFLPSLSSLMQGKLPPCPPTLPRQAPVTMEEWESFRSADGKISKREEMRFRARVFSGVSLSLKCSVLSISPSFCFSPYTSQTILQPVTPSHSHSLTPSLPHPLTPSSLTHPLPHIFTPSLPHPHSPPHSLIPHSPPHSLIPHPLTPSQGLANNKVRREIWRYLLNYYPFDVTEIERMEIRRNKEKEYWTMKQQWQSFTQEQENRFTKWREAKVIISEFHFFIT